MCSVFALSGFFSQAVKSFDVLSMAQFENKIQNQHVLAAHD